MTFIVKCCVSYVTLFISFHTLAQSCPPIKRPQKIEKFDRIFGGNNPVYCINDIQNLSLENKNIVGKWGIVRGKTKTRFYNEKYHKKIKALRFRGQFEGMKTIYLNTDRSFVIIDTAEKRVTKSSYWAYPDSSSKLKGHYSEFGMDSTDSEIKGTGRIYIFEPNEENNYLNFFRFRVISLKKNTLIIGNNHSTDPDGFQIKLRRLKQTTHNSYILLN